MMMIQMKYWWYWIKDEKICECDGHINGDDFGGYTDDDFHHNDAFYGSFKGYGSDVHSIKNKIAFGIALMIMVTMMMMMMMMIVMMF